MSLFPALLWKEWRDHRAALLGYFIGIPPLIAWGLTALEAPMRKEPLLPSAAAVGGFAIAALTLFGDLFANEEQRGTIKLLRRLPSGLSKVFIGKIGFALIAAIAMSGWAYLATTTAVALLYGGPFLPRISLPAVAWLSLVFPLAAWISAAAIWLSRATLALPAAALTLALFGAPIGAALWLNPGMKPTPRELLIAFVALTATGPFVAGASFVLGRRRSARAFAPAKVGLLATLLLFTPAYAWTGACVSSFLRIEPAERSFRIASGFGGALSVGGRFAYFDAFHLSDERSARGFTDHDSDRGDGPLHPLCVDLEGGTVRELGPPGSIVAAPGSWQGMGRVATPVVGVFLWGITESLKPGDRGWRLFDATTGSAVAPDLAEQLHEQRGARAGELWRASTWLRLPDGRRTWRQDDQLFVDPGRALPDSRFDSSASFGHFTTAGFGVCLGFGATLDHRVWYDPLRERRFKVPSQLMVRYVRGGRWIVHDLSSSTKSRTGMAYDPETGDLTPIAGWVEYDGIVDLAPDGRLLVLANHGTPRVPDTGLVLLDPDSGERETIAWPTAIDRRVGYVRVAGWTPSGTALLRLQSQGHDSAWFARLELATPGVAGAAIVPTTTLDSAELLGASDEDSLIAIESARRLVRLRFDGSPPELLFPR